MQCKECHTENQQDSKFCRQCGTHLERELQAVPGDPGAYYCGRHQKVATRVRCSRCETPICPKCMVPGAVGILCRECARDRTPVRIRGVLHEAGRGLESTARGAGRMVWYLAIWSFLISIIRSFFGGRNT